MSALGQKQTCAAQKVMSAKCQKRTFMRIEFLVFPEQVLKLPVGLRIA